MKINEIIAIIAGTDCIKNTFFSIVKVANIHAINTQTKKKKIIDTDHNKSEINNHQNNQADKNKL